jgi:[ribosomal protein S5]-alanine N-acetyltransferase
MTAPTPDPSSVLTRGDVTLRRFVPADAPDVTRLMTDENILKWLRDRVPSPYQLSDAETFIRDVAPLRETFAIVHGGTLAGAMGGDFQGDVYARTMEVGYWLGASFWGKGLASTSVGLLCDHIFRTHATIERLEAGVFEGNHASARVLEKNGFIREAVRAKRVFKRGKLLDEWAYARVR